MRRQKSWTGVFPVYEPGLPPAPDHQGALSAKEVWGFAGLARCVFPGPPGSFGPAEPFPAVLPVSWPLACSRVVVLSRGS